MKIPGLSLAILSLLFVSATNIPTAITTTTAITGDYVEVRTASVFAGACHYNGELVTTGQDAMLAWNVAGGTWKGTDLAGVKAVAAITSGANLADGHPRKAELVIDSSATEAQAAAFTSAIETRYAAALGTVISVKREAVTFAHTSAGYKVTADQFATCTVQPMPNAECCKQPNLVWYSPLISLQNRKVGYTVKAAYTAGTLAEAWQRDGENDAFYGHFSF